MGKKKPPKVSAISCECGSDGKCRSRLVSRFNNTVIDLKDQDKVEEFKAVCNEYNKFITGIPATE